MNEETKVLRKLTKDEIFDTLKERLVPKKYEKEAHAMFSSGPAIASPGFSNWAHKKKRRKIAAKSKARNRR